MDPRAEALLADTGKFPESDSRKNANTPSIASVWPITPPAYCAKRAQLVPNWNSIGMPVTTPMTKLMPKILAQNRAALL